MNSNILNEDKLGSSMIFNKKAKNASNFWFSDNKIWGSLNEWLYSLGKTWVYSPRILTHREEWHYLCYDIGIEKLL